MGTIVVLTKQYLNKPTANGICVHNIVSELQKTQTVYVISCEKTECPDSKEVASFSLKADDSFNSAGICFFLKKILRLIKTALRIESVIFNKSFVQQYFDRLQDYNDSHKVDHVVAVYYPHESIQAACLFKSLHPNVKITFYELDSYGDGVKQSRLNSFNSLYNSWIKKAYRTADSVIVMRSHAEYWQKTFGGITPGKLLIADIPCLTRCGTASHNQITDKCVLLYSGLIEKKYRSPSYLLKVLQCLQGKIPYEFFFYSKGDCEEEIAEAAKENKCIRQMGYVSKDELNEATYHAAILVSIGNASSRSVPSKIINYMSFGKPILHFSSQKDDVCKDYLSKYPLALVIDESTDVQEASKLIIAFIERVNGQTVDFDKIKERFFMNDPQYSAKLIVEGSRKE